MRTNKKFQKKKNQLKKKENVSNQTFLWVLQSSKYFQIENINTSVTLKENYSMHFRLRDSKFLGQMKNGQKEESA